jgi:hypothetical protein
VTSCFPLVASWRPSSSTTCPMSNLSPAAGHLLQNLLLEATLNILCDLYPTSSMSRRLAAASVNSMTSVLPFCSWRPLPPHVAAWRPPPVLYDHCPTFLKLPAASLYSMTIVLPFSSSRPPLCTHRPLSYLSQAAERLSVLYDYCPTFVKLAAASLYSMTIVLPFSSWWPPLCTL